MTKKEKELNIAKLLRRYNADKIYLVDEGEVELVEIIDKFTVDVKGVDGRPIRLRDETLEIKPNGFAYLYPSKEAFLKYPLEAAKAWQEWAEERKPKRWYPKSREEAWFLDLNLNPHKKTDTTIECVDWSDGINCFQTEELCQQAAEAVKRTLEEFHEKHPQA